MNRAIARISLRVMVGWTAMVTTTNSSCSNPHFDNCADPAASCMEVMPAPPEGAKVINDFEASARSPGSIRCTQLFLAETCDKPLRNLLGLCADDLFCSFRGSTCASQVTGSDAFRGKSWRIQFNESLLTDPNADASAGGQPTDYPFSGYSEFLTSQFPHGSDCDASRLSFDGTDYSTLTFWVKAEDRVDFEVSLKSERPTGTSAYPETNPKVSLVACTGWPQSCVCRTYGQWRKICLPLSKLQQTAGSLVDLSHLLEINMAFAAFPYATEFKERAVGEVTIDDLAFEP